MDVLGTRRPGQRGTRKLVTRYGDRLICVRYRYDAGTGKRYKTVELIVEESAGTPPPPPPETPKPPLKREDINPFPPPREVGVKVFYRESALREQVKAAGGRWLKNEKLWQLPFETAVALGLEHRIARR